jgi:hypothetical protein
VRPDLPEHAPSYPAQAAIAAATKPDPAVIADPCSRSAAGAERPCRAAQDGAPTLLDEAAYHLPRRAADHGSRSRADVRELIRRRLFAQ